MKKSLVFALLAALVFSALFAFSGCEDAPLPNEAIAKAPGVVICAPEGDELASVCAEKLRTRSPDAAIRIFECAPDKRCQDDLVKKISALDKEPDVLIFIGEDFSASLPALTEEYPEALFFSTDEKASIEGVFTPPSDPVAAGYLAGYYAASTGSRRFFLLSDEENEESRAFGKGFFVGALEGAGDEPLYAARLFAGTAERDPAVTAVLDNALFSGTDLVCAIGQGAIDDAVQSAARTGKRAIFAARDHEGVCVYTDLLAWLEVSVGTRLTGAEPERTTFVALSGSSGDTDFTQEDLNALYARLEDPAFHAGLSAEKDLASAGLSLTELGTLLS